MAIHPELHQVDDPQGNLSPQQTRSISAWTEQATASLEELTLAEPAPRGASLPLTIPLHDPAPVTPPPQTRLIPRPSVPKETKQAPSVSFRRRELLEREALKRREALQKGKDGSRRRQRWENDRLLHNPWVEPPSPNDWLVQPTYPRHNNVPYYLAPLWDVHYSHLDKQGVKCTKEEKHRVPKELRMRLKHARAARGMLQDLEEDIRQFIQKWNEKQLLLQKEGLDDAPQSSDDGGSEDEVVFVGRNGQMHDSPTRQTRFREIREAMSTHNERDGEKMVFESLVEDRPAGFGRWLVHSIASYYGLHTWSITVGEPARREAYVGFRPPAPDRRTVISNACRPEAMIQAGESLPQPLWAQI